MQIFIDQCFITDILSAGEADSYIACRVLV